MKARLSIRCALLAAFLAVLVLPASGAYAGSEAPATDDAPAVCAANLARDLAERQGHGWHLTAAGKAVIAGAKLAGVDGALPPFTGQLGMVLLGTSDEAVGSLQAIRSLQATVPNDFFCDYGAPANLTFSTGPGTSYVSWWRTNVFGIMSNVTGPTGNCSQTSCYWYAFHDPPSSWRVVTGTIHAASWVVVLQKWCSF